MAGVCEVLVVDDDIDIRESVRELLEMEGYQVHEAGDGAEALRLLAALHRPCVVLLDLMMPGMEGAEFLRHLHTDPQFASIQRRSPVVVMSANVEGTRRIDLRQVAAVITKPFEMDHLVAIIRELCAPEPGALK